MAPSLPRYATFLCQSSNKASDSTSRVMFVSLLATSDGDVRLHTCATVRKLAQAITDRDAAADGNTYDYSCAYDGEGEGSPLPKDLVAGREAAERGLINPPKARSGSDGASAGQQENPAVGNGGAARNDGASSSGPAASARRRCNASPRALRSVHASYLRCAQPHRAARRASAPATQWARSQVMQCFDTVPALTPCRLRCDQYEDSMQALAAAIAPGPEHTRPKRKAEEPASGSAKRQARGASEAATDRAPSSDTSADKIEETPAWLDTDPLLAALADKAFTTEVTLNNKNNPANKLRDAQARLNQVQVCTSSC